MCLREKITKRVSVGPSLANESTMVAMVTAHVTHGNSQVVTVNVHQLHLKLRGSLTVYVWQK